MLFRPNRHFTLGNFIPNRANQYARATGAWFIHARRPRPNTLLVTGPTGSGKSHLLHALANFAKQNEVIRSMACMDAQQFANEMDYGCFYRDLDAVLDRFAAEDLLAVDNVDRVSQQYDSAALLVGLMEVRQARNKRTLLTATTPGIQAASIPLAALLHALPTVRLAA